MALIIPLIALYYVSIIKKPLAADDYYWYSSSITQSPWQYLAKDMLPDDPNANFLRPIPILTFALESKFRNLFPHLPHSRNICIHIINSILLALIIALPLKNSKSKHLFATVAGVLIFAFHPQATGAVCWASSRFDLICGMFGLIGLYAWLSATSKNKKILWYTISSIAFTLSVLSKEAGLVFLFAVLSWELIKYIYYSLTNIKEKSLYPASCILLITIIYILYRILVLNGMGGYSNISTNSIHPGSFIGYSLVTAIPFLTTITDHFSAITISLSTALVGIIFLVSKKQETTKPNYPWLLPILICLFSFALLSLVPLKIQQILNHAESRYTYVSLIGFSILAGWLLGTMANIKFGNVIIPVVLSVFLCFSIQSQQSEIAKWNNAAQTAESILDQIKELVPAPPQNATYIFENVPMVTDRYYYIFGIGLPEAIADHYKRDDLIVHRWPERNILNSPPSNSYTFSYDYTTSKVELIAHKN